jgi:hypothetical protein
MVILSRVEVLSIPESELAALINAGERFHMSSSSGDPSTSVREECSVLTVLLVLWNLKLPVSFSSHFMNCICFFNRSTIFT